MPSDTGQMPTSRRASVDFPEALGPMMPSTSPGCTAKLTLCNTASPFEPGGVAVMPSTDSAPAGRGRDMPVPRSGCCSSSLTSRLYDSLAALQLFQTLITCSIGARVRPIRIEPAIIMPGVMWPSMANQPPSPSTRDCRERRTNLVIEVTVAARSLATRWLFRKRLCSENQRRFRFGSMPNASITSALRRLALASPPDMIDSLLASPSGFLETISLATARAIRIKEPTRANNPSQGLNKKITSR
ncbi:Uncharacterised protein [Serratia entomophila]|nr:Uncharacterised protein [Serratia entomophila]CAI0984262.1 Uncharacterised protein [Serratia entomophila]CAI1611418.1 Uncharacterised protein [Serratia entomophila]CAI1932421.1 Uncharacterised protein [Serratia entomophila]